MKYVYLLQSIGHSAEKYVGITDDFERRI